MRFPKDSSETDPSYDFQPDLHSKIIDHFDKIMQVMAPISAISENNENWRWMNNNLID